MRIKEIMKEKKMTSKELAAKMGISPPSVSVAIRGNMTIDMLKRIAAALDVSVADLFEEKKGDVICPSCGARLRFNVSREGGK
jgi:transcriptional regulator with XRE-family HTH domain